MPAGWGCALVGALVLFGARASAEPPPPTDHPPLPTLSVSMELHAAYLSAIIDGEPMELSLGLAGHLAWRPSHRAALVLSLENTWFAVPQREEVAGSITVQGRGQGVLALGVGVDIPYAHGRLRAFATAGPSVLLRNLAVDDAGRFGFFVDARPVGIRVPLRRGPTLVIDPLSITTLFADLTGIPLIVVQYRTSIAVELGR